MSLLALFLAVLVGPAADLQKLDLKGVVRDDTGAPLKGATVLIFTARPRKGVGTICPSCYLDCWRQATTDDEGRFTIEKVDASLVFRVGALTSAHDPAFAPDVDPAAGDAEIKLHPRTPLPDSPRRVLRARVVDLDGSPVAHAVLSPKGFRSEYGGGSYGSIPGLPKITLTDAKGAFSMAAGKDVEGTVILEVTARGLSTTIVDVAPKLDEQTFAIGPGCAVRGRAVRDSKPVAGLTFGIVQVERASGSFVGEMTTAVSNAEGLFVLANVMPNELTVLYSKMLDAAKLGGAPMKYVETGDHGGVIDVGDLPVRSAVRLTGRLLMPEGQPVPPDSTLSLHRQAAWDSLTLPVGENGAFAADLLPGEPFTFSAGVRGYRLADKHGRLGRRSPGIGPLERDRELSLPLERAPARPPR